MHFPTRSSIFNHLFGVKQTQEAQPLASTGTRRTGDRRNNGNAVRPLVARSIETPTPGNMRVKLSKEEAALMTAKKQLDKALTLLSGDFPKKARPALKEASKALKSVAAMYPDQTDLVRTLCARSLHSTLPTLDPFKLTAIQLALLAHFPETNDPVIQQLGASLSQTFATSSGAGYLHGLVHALNHPGHKVVGDTHRCATERRDAYLQEVAKLAPAMILMALSYASSDADLSSKEQIPGMKFTIKELRDIHAEVTKALAPHAKAEYDAVMLVGQQRMDLIHMPAADLKALKSAVQLLQEAYKASHPQQPALIFASKAVYPSLSDLNFIGKRIELMEAPLVGALH
ncbi:hypothetical protein [Hydrogenophaga sp.]|uniref:hypothetical protein n=1 Tax=Hydrogenophaga sp. TaxID=1904254 RepID=UPI002718BF53|nr:hypothetical protein [Hydrogenophaga sp.]MDO9435218.1 hypothetical protein [Hydrogenophaga sp.]